ncbi:hypothetical protein ES705_02262 [subsurface metagenome]|nr:oligosaccharide flippase family protein [Clostridia bacterium]
MKTGVQKRQVFRNATMSVVQVIVTGGVLFILYRFLLNTIGVEQLGVWSVVLATTSVASLANLGLSGSVVKFVAKYVARNEEETVAGVIQTSAVSVTVFIGLVLLIAYPFASWLLSLVMPVANIKGALSILPYALLSLWIMVIASVFQAAIDGYQRIDLRSVLLMAGVLIHLVLCFVLVPTHGLMGLAYSQVTQAGLILIGSWLILKRRLPSLPIIPYQWNRKLFREMVGYGLNFQVISISRMLCDPVTKVLLTKFGGLSMTGFYEMASRMILQLRALLVEANRVLVPVIAGLQERNPNLIQNIYEDNYRLMVYIALPFYSIIIALTPSISEIWIGHYEAIFVIFSVLLAVSLCINTLSVPAYFSYLGIGKLKWNTLSHITTALMNAILGLTVGYIFGGIGVVTAWIFSSITGSLMIAISYHYSHKIPIIELLPKASRTSIIACLIGILSALLIHHKLNDRFDTIALNSIIILSFSIIVFIPFWLHPMRKRLMGWVTNELLNMKSRL